MKKIKLLYLISTLRRCGPTNVMWNIIKELDKGQFDIHIATLAPEGLDSIIDEVENSGIIVYKLNCGNFWPITAIYQLWMLLKEIKPHIIHSHGVRPDIITGVCGKNTVTMSTIHNVPLKVYQQKYGKICGKIMSCLQVVALSAIDVPVSCSRAVNSAWQMNFGLLSDVVCNGIDIRGTTNILPVAKLAARQKLHIKEKVPMFISTGGLSSWKRPDVMIRGFCESKMGQYGILYLCGTGDMLKECQRLAGSKQNIIFTGPVKNIREYLLAADYYVTASELEGMPNAVLEAMAFELPVIMSMIPPHREILSYDQGAGCLFPSDGVQELAMIFNSVEDFRKDAGQRAKQIVEQHFSSKVMANQYARRYKEMVDKGDFCFAKETLNRS